MLKPEFKRMVKGAGELASSEEDLLTYALFPQAAPKFLKLKKEGRERTDEEKAAAAAALAAFLSREPPRTYLQ